MAPLYATGVFAVATLAIVTFAAPASLRSMASAPIETCVLPAMTVLAAAETRG